MQCRMLWYYLLQSDHGSAPKQSPQVQVEYSLKIINRLIPGGAVERFSASVFHSKQELEEKIMCTLESEKLIKSTDGVQFGYIMPGHGFKGKQQLVDSDADVATMYDSYKKKTPIIIWAKIKAHARKRLSISDVNSGVPPKKKKPEEDKNKPARHSSYQGHLSKMAEVDSIVDELEEKHTSGEFSPEQLRAWAHMIQLNKHVSYDEPPDKPFFRQSKLKKRSTSEPQGISPAKRITLRSECIDQLEKWHKLMELGAITQDQYVEHKDTIMSDIKKF